MAGTIFSKASGLNNSIFGKSEAPIKAFLEARAQANEQLSIADKLFTKVTSDKYAEKFGSLTSMAHGFKPVGEGGAYPRDERQEGYSKTIEAVTWKDSFVITQEMIEDGIIFDMNRIGAGSFMDKFYDGKERFASALLGGATGNTVNYEGVVFNTQSADGVSLFNAAHPTITGNTATQSNLFSNAFSVDALGMVMTAMQGFTDDNGQLLTITPDTIIIPNNYALKKAVFAAIGSEKDPGTANNGFNFLFGSWRVICSPYLNGLISGSDVPYILMDSKYNERYYGLVWMERVPLTIKTWVDNNTDNAVWNGRARFSAGFNDWRAVAMGGVTSGSALT